MLHMITEHLMEQMLVTSFISHLDQICHAAALEQDEIGWQNFQRAKYQRVGVISN